MEHRYGQRFPTDLKALIYQNGLPVAIGCIRNYSRAGVFIHTDFAQAEVNQQIEIEVIARGNSRSPASYGERRLCKAIVMHKNNGGLGLLMREDSAETQRHFSAIVDDEIIFAETAERIRTVQMSAQHVLPRRIAF